MSKLQLKAARDAIKNCNYEYAESVCDEILLQQPSNYTALVFQGLALKELAKFQKSIESYKKAILIDNTNILAYQGLLKTHEATQDVYLEINTLYRIFGLIKSGRVKALGVYQKETADWKWFSRIECTFHNNQDVDLLQDYLPTSKSYDLIKTFDIPSPKSIMLQTCLAYEVELKDKIEEELRVQKSKLTSRSMLEIRLQVEGEMVLKSQLEDIYDNILLLELTSNELIDHEIRMLSFLARKIYHTDRKSETRIKITNLVDHILDSNIYSFIACKLKLDYQDLALDRTDMTKFIDYLDCISEDSPIHAKLFQIYDKRMQGSDLNEILSDCLEALELESTSIWGNQMLMHTHLDLKDWDGAAQVGDNLKNLLKQKGIEIDTSFPNMMFECDLVIAQAYANMGNDYSQRSLKMYQDILVFDGNNEEALIGISRLLIISGKPIEAREFLEKILSNNNSNSVALSEIGWTYYQTHEFQKALDFLNEAQSINECSLNHYRIAKTYWEMGGEFRADKSYTHSHLIKAIKLDPSFSKSFTALGHFYAFDNDIDRAVKCYSKAATIDIKDEVAVQSLLEIWIKSAKLKESIDLLELFTESTPRSKWAWKQLGIIYLSQGSDRAIPTLQTSLRIVSGDVHTWIALGDAYQRKGKYVAALKTLNRALDIKGLASGYYLKALVHQKLGMFVESLEFIDRFDGAAALILKAETLVLYARECYELKAFGKCVVLFIRAIDIGLVDTNSSILPLKLIGDSCLYLYRLVPRLIKIDTIYPILQKLEKLGIFVGACSQILLDRDSPVQIVLQCAILAYKIWIAKSNKKLIFTAPIYSDLSTAFHFLYTESQNDVYQGLAIESCKSSLSGDLKNPDFFIILAVMTRQSDPKLSQHAFIQALVLDGNNTLSWSNLGYFYLMYSNISLAMQSFKKAQLVDSDDAFGWFGQALIDDKAEVGLMRHAFELGAKNYEILYRFARSSLDLTDGNYALLKCAELKIADHVCWNLHGLYLERQSLFSLAIDAFQKSVELCADDISNENLARCFCANGNYVESIKYYQKVIDRGNSYTYTGYGLALYFNGDYSDSITIFEQALEMCTLVGDKKLFNDLSINLAQILYALGTEDHIAVCKQQLFQCFTNDPTFVDAIICLCALGLVVEDWNLAQTSASELLSLNPHDKDDDVDYILSGMFLLQNDVITARRFLIKSIHRSPWKSYLWSRLSEFIYQNDTYSEYAAITISNCIKLDNSSADNTNQSHGDIRRIAGLVQLWGGVSSSTQISRSIFINPSCGNNWLALSLELSCSNDFSLLRYSKSIADRCLNLTFDTLMKPWAQLIACSAVIQLFVSNDTQPNNCLGILDAITTNNTGLVSQYSSMLMGKLLYIVRENDMCIKSLKQSISIDKSIWIAPLLQLAFVYENEGQLLASKLCLDYSCRSRFHIVSKLKSALILIRLGRYALAMEYLIECLQLKEVHQDSIKFIHTLILLKIDGDKNRKRINKNLLDMKSQNIIHAELIKLLEI